MHSHFVACRPFFPHLYPELVYKLCWATQNYSARQCRRQCGRGRRREKWPNEYEKLLVTPYSQSNGLSQFKWYLALLLANREQFPLFTKDQSKSRQGIRLFTQISTKSTQVCSGMWVPVLCRYVYPTCFNRRSLLKLSPS